MATKIDQKEYLKRYLSNDKEKKKKKKKEKKAVTKANVRIIDDDLDLSKFQHIQDDEVDMGALGEDAPQVVGIIDERPPEMRAKEDFGSNKWKVVAASDGFDTTLEVRDISKRRSGTETGRDFGHGPASSSTGKRKGQDSDESPPRLPTRVRDPTNRQKHSDESLLRESSSDKGRKNFNQSPIRRRYDSDESPARKRPQEADVPKSRGRRKDSDESPPRKQKHSSSERSKQARTDRYDSDESPPRKSRPNVSDESSSGRLRMEEKKIKSNRQRKDSDESPPRRHRAEIEKKLERSKKRQDSDESPPRRRIDKEADSKDSGKQNVRSPSTRDRRNDSDESPPRKSRSDRTSFKAHNKAREDSDESPPRRDGVRQTQSSSRREVERNDRRRGVGRPDSDESPPRRKRYNSREAGPSRRSPHRSHRASSPGSSVRIKQEKNRSDSDLSPPRNPGRSSRRDSDESPPRRRARGNSARPPPPVIIKEENRSSEDASPSRDSATGRMTKTLDGKRAGLQDARSLRVENEKHKRREAEAFEKMAVEHTGRYAETVVRQKSGRRKDIEKELREEFEKRKQEEKKKEIYTRWGKGVKQLEDYNTRLQEAAHEMEKPLARYADDKDLDEHLKQQEREGDPMLEYLRSKRKEENRRAGIPEKPTYQGAFPDNRFNIRPGYRWDGVDRSNGFEKRWFEMTSKKKATEEEAYKYSVEDM